MHRVRTWARAKAHGRSPLTSEPRRVASNAIAPSNPPGTPATEPKPPQTDASVETTAGDKPAPVKKNVAVRFFTVFKDVLFSSVFNVLLVFVPVGIAVHFAKMPAGVVFAMNAIAIIPLAGLLSHATESVASRLGDTIGALMNVTFGNAVELIIFIIALVKNEIRIVQASLLGSILANLLLILGMCFLFGGLRFREQIYNSTVTQMSACLLSLSVTSLLLPTAFHASFSDSATADDRVLQVSRGTSVILLLVYGLYLLFQLNSHSYMYESTPQYIIERESVPGPAAQYFNSSSSSESSSSSSDSDDSGQSVNTAKKIKRMVKGKNKRNRKQSSSSPPAPPTSEPADPLDSTGITPAQADAITSIGSSSVIVPVEAVAADDAMEEADEMADQPTKQRKRHRHHRKRRSGDLAGEDELEQTQSAPTQSAPTQGGGETRRVDFVLAPDVEAQRETTRSTPFSLRALRPAIPKNLSQNVFRQPPQAPLQTVASNGSAPQPLRRSRSMPSPREPEPPQGYRASPGAIPPIVPIVVNSTPKTTTVEDEEPEDQHISRTSAILLLLGSTALVALCAEFMVDSINEVVGDGSGISEAFIGLILLPIVGNAAEHVTAVTVAMKNKMDLAIGVAVGSSIQIAIFVTPLVVILGWIMNKQMTLFFTLFETVSLFVSAFIVNFLVLDGRSNYLEGALLCSGYIIIAVAAFYYPGPNEASSIGGGDTNATETVVAARLFARGLANLVGF